MVDKSKEYRSARLILLQDTGMMSLASLAAILLVRWLSEPIPGFTFIVLEWVGIALVASLLGILITGSHRSVRRYMTVRSTAKIVGAILFKEVALSLVLVFGLIRFGSAALCVVAIFADLLLSIAIISYLRYSASLYASEKTDVKEVAARGNALVMGTGASSVLLAKDVEEEGKYDVVGFVSADRAMSGRVIEDKVVYFCADPDDLNSLQWKVGGIDCVFFPKDWDHKGKKSGESKTQVTPQADGMTRTGHFFKRAFDILVSGVLLILFSPVIAICAIAVKLQDGGEVIFAQERIGRDGKPFKIYKFRSMRPDAEAAGAQLYSGDGDPRLTKVGRFLRNHHLDELPQLWNVLKGDMSFIGYRPERQVYIDQIMQHNPRYRYLYQIRPGVTSYATLYNGYTDTMEKMLTRLDLDLYWLRNHSLWFDAKVLGLTFLSIVTGKKF